VAGALQLDPAVVARQQHEGHRVEHDADAAEQDGGGERHAQQDRVHAEPARDAGADAADPPVVVGRRTPVRRTRAHSWSRTCGRAGGTGGSSVLWLMPGS
jgi:hypothetical protein